MPQYQEANECLSQYYPKNGVCQVKDYNHGKTRAEITKLNLSNEQLSGQLDLSDFVNLEELNCWFNQITELILPLSGSLQWLNCYGNQLTNLDLSNSVNLIKLRVNNNQLTELDVSKQPQLIRLDCANNNLTSLNLSNNKLLEYLDFNNNQLTHLDLTGLTQLAKIATYNNQLTTFNYENLNPQALNYLWLSNNNLSPTDLNVFSQLVNLEGLFIGNDDKEKINQGIYNRFTGSLQSLQNLTKLEELNISNTDINKGLEYLPVSIKYLHYDTKKRPNCQLKVIEKELDQFKDWRDFYRSLEKEEPKLFAIINSELTLPVFKLVLNDQRIPLTDNTYPNLFKRWKKDYLKKYPQAFEIHTIKSDLKAKEDKIAELETKLQNNTLNIIELEQLQNEKSSLEKELKQLKSQLNEILTKESTTLLTAKEQELEKAKKKFKKVEHACEDLLEAVNNLAVCDISSTRENDWKVKEKNTKRLREANFSEKEIDNLCDLQTEITQLKLKLENLKSSKQLSLTSGQKEQLLLEFTDNPVFTQNLLTQVNNYLQAKQSFLNLRQETIQLLREVCDLIEKQTLTSQGKYVKREEGTKMFTALLKITPISEGMLGTNELLIESISVTFNQLKRRFNEKNSAIFKQYLERSDNFTELTKQRDFLIKLLNKNPHYTSSQQMIELFNLDLEDNSNLKFFTEEYQIYKVATNIWKDKTIITSDDMKTAIADLTKNVNLLEKELAQEKKAISKLTKQVTNYQQEQQLLTYIEQKEF